MLIELTIWTVGKYLIRLTKKFGIDWLNRNLKVDKELGDLLYETAENPDDPDKFGNLLYYLSRNKNSFEAIKNEIPVIEKLDEVKKEPNLLKPGAKIDVYKELLEVILQIVALRRHPIVLEGFLNGSGYVSYYDYHYNNLKVTSTQCLVVWQ
jgi:hypothetical protein